MKKLFFSLMAVLMVAVMAFGFTGCSGEVENGSKIQKVKIELSIYDASGEVTATTDVYFKLYLNYAPNSTAHIVKLINQGFYNGVCVSNITSNWLEFGSYAYNNEGLIAPKDYTYGTVEGEFLNNGLKGNLLTSSKGAVILKRDYDDNTVESGQSKYDTATCGLVVCLTSSASSTFSSNSYCVLGMVVSDDGDEDAETDLEQKSSIDKLASLTEYKSVEDDDGNTVVTYYYEKENKYYTKWTDDEGSVHYAEGASVSGTELTEDEVTAFQKTFSDNKNYFLTVPCVKLVINTVTLVK